MLAQPFSHDPRRTSPRIVIEGFCTELLPKSERHGYVVDLSETGLRLERPFFGGRRGPTLQLEFELPGLDEVMWARGDVCFDHVLPPRMEGGGLIRSTGIRLATLASRDLRLLREYVFELNRFLEPRCADPDVLWASCYQRG